MTQDEFNAMMEIWMATQATGGYYVSKYSGEEVDALLTKVEEQNPGVITHEVTV